MREALQRGRARIRGSGHIDNSGLIRKVNCQMKGSVVVLFMAFLDSMKSRVGETRGKVRVSIKLTVSVLLVLGLPAHSPVSLLFSFSSSLLVIVGRPVSLSFRYLALPPCKTGASLRSLVSPSRFLSYIYCPPPTVNPIFFHCRASDSLSKHSKYSTFVRSVVQKDSPGPLPCLALLRSLSLLSGLSARSVLRTMERETTL